MTRKEQTGKRDLEFSGWVRSNLPDSSGGFAASDLDFILWNWKTKRVMMLEIKTMCASLRPFQRMMFENIERWIRQGIDDSWVFYGFHFLVFEKLSFDSGKAWLDNVLITEKEAIEYFSMDNKLF